MNKKNLGIAYNVKRMAKGGKVGCMDCMAKGGKCMAHGGEVENEKLHPDAEVELPSRMEEVEENEMEDGDDESEEDRHYAQGGVVDEIMSERKMKRMSSGGLLDAGVEDDFEKRLDLQPMHTREDEEHPDMESPSKDDDSLVGQIIRDRKKRRGE